MSKKIISLIVWINIVACNQTQNNTSDKTQVDTTHSKSLNSSSHALMEYKLFISKLDTFNVNTASIAARKYQELLKNEDVAIRDKGFVVFNSHYEKLYRNLNELHEKDTTNFDPLIMLDASGNSLPVPQKLKDYNAKLQQNGFEVSSTEGTSYIEQNRDFIAKWFYSHVSPLMQEYLVQVNKENKEGFQEDAGLTIEPKQYVDRLIWWEKFMMTNPGFILVDKAKENQKYLLTFFLVGMDNSPVVSYETGKLDDYYKTAYEYLQKNFSRSETNRIVNPYYKALLANDKIKATALISDYKKKRLIFDFGQD